MLTGVESPDPRPPPPASSITTTIPVTPAAMASSKPRLSALIMLFLSTLLLAAPVLADFDWGCHGKVDGKEAVAAVDKLAQLCDAAAANGDSTNLANQHQLFQSTDAVVGGVRAYFCQNVEPDKPYNCSSKLVDTAWPDLDFRCGGSFDAVDASGWMRLNEAQWEFGVISSDAQWCGWEDHGDESIVDAEDPVDSEDHLDSEHLPNPEDPDDVPVAVLTPHAGGGGPNWPYQCFDMLNSSETTRAVKRLSKICDERPANLGKPAPNATQPVWGADVIVGDVRAYYCYPTIPNITNGLCSSQLVDESWSDIEFFCGGSVFAAGASGWQRLPVTMDKGKTYTLFEFGIVSVESTICDFQFQNESDTRREMRPMPGLPPRQDDGLSLVSRRDVYDQGNTTWYECGEKPLIEVDAQDAVDALAKLCDDSHGNTTFCVHHGSVTAFFDVIDIPNFQCVASDVNDSWNNLTRLCDGPQWGGLYSHMNIGWWFGVVPNTGSCPVVVHLPDDDGNGEPASLQDQGEDSPIVSQHQVDGRNDSIWYTCEQDVLNVDDAIAAVDSLGHHCDDFQERNNFCVNKGNVTAFFAVNTTYFHCHRGVIIDSWNNLTTLCGGPQFPGIYAHGHHELEWQFGVVSGNMSCDLPPPPTPGDDRNGQLPSGQDKGSPMVSQHQANGQGNDTWVSCGQDPLNLVDARLAVQSLAKECDTNNHENNLLCFNHGSVSAFLEVRDSNFQCDGSTVYSMWKNLTQFCNGPLFGGYYANEQSGILWQFGLLPSIDGICHPSSTSRPTATPDDAGNGELASRQDVDVYSCDPQPSNEDEIRSAVNSLVKQ